uniref:Uncharacterized protein n=1 Tax=Anguilla anguilla TaxID=7936 RepID=A0A0E9UUX2_ANGAN
MIASEAPYADWHSGAAHQKGSGSLAPLSARLRYQQCFVLYSHCLRHMRCVP